MIQHNGIRLVKRYGTHCASSLFDQIQGDILMAILLFICIILRWLKLLGCTRQCFIYQRCLRETLQLQLVRAA